MSNLIQKVLEAEKRRNSDRKEPAASFTEAARNLASLSGIFEGLIGARIKDDVMEKNKILPEIDDRGAISAYKMLRTRVLQRMRANNWRSLIVSSTSPGEGKSLTASNLAVSISNDVNQSVVLIDLDLQRSSLAKNFGLEVEAGIGDYLLGDATIDEVVYTPKGMDRIAIVPNRAPVKNSSDLIASPKMRQLLEWVYERSPNTIAIFDMPPVLASDDVIAFTNDADAILMVVSEGLTERNSLARAMEMIDNCNFLGVVLNRSREHGAVGPYY